MDSSCDHIDYHYSIYAIVLPANKPAIIPVNYRRGTYLMYLFDTTTNGVLVPSMDNKCFSKSGKLVYLHNDTYGK